MDTISEDEKYMKEALKQARKAAEDGEAPIGCVITREGKIIARGHNKRNKSASAIAHAEMIAINKACAKLNDWRLEECAMYITLEPCPMCAGAIIQARIPLVVIGAMNPKAGCAGSILDMFSISQFNHRVEKRTGVLKDECAAVMTGFFSDLREKKRNRGIDKRQA